MVTTGQWWIGTEQEKLEKYTQWWIGTDRANLTVVELYLQGKTE
jgi:hypothetical protein